MSKKMRAGMLIGLGFILPTLIRATIDEEGRAFAKQLHDQGYKDKSDEMNAMKQTQSQKQENQHLDSQTSELGATFEGNYDSGRKDEDPLKSHFAQKNAAVSKNKHPNQPSLGDAELLLKQKHRFQISQEDTLFKKHQEISQGEIETKDPLFQKGQPPVQPKPTLQDKIITCRKGVAPELRSCVKRLVVKAVPQTPIVKTVTAYFAAQCFNLVSFSIDLKTGQIGISQCQNQGYSTVSVDNPIGQPELPEKTTVELLAHQHFGEGGVEFRNSQLVPSHANGFWGSFTAFQPKTGSRHRENRDLVRGGRYTWKITMPRFPILQEYWEGCEDLERQVVDQTCELVGLEQKSINETRAIPGYSHPMTRSHWVENKDFLCGGGREIDDCETLIKQKCEQIDSKCAVYKNNICIEHENTFRCKVSDYQKTDGLTFNNGNISFLSGHGEPTKESYNPADFGEAISHFSALTEMGKDMQDNLGGIIGDPNNPSIFHGQCRQCRVNLGSFVRDCCKLKGVLQGLLGKCSEEERKLAIATLRNKRCVKIEGRYCHKKRARICVEKRDSYCCYGSQLARILQEIAHQQLGISWGSAKQPNCSGITADQLSRIDFDTPYAQQKLSEILAEVQATAQEKFERVQQAVAAAKNLSVKAKELEAKHSQIEKETKTRLEKQHQGVNQ